MPPPLTVGGAIKTNKQTNCNKLGRVLQLQMAAIDIVFIDYKKSTISTSATERSSLMPISYTHIVLNIINEIRQISSHHTTLYDTKLRTNHSHAQHRCFNKLL